MEARDPIVRSGPRERRGPRAPTARKLRPEEGRDPPEQQRALPAHCMPAREGGDSLKQEEGGGAPQTRRRRRGAPGFNPESAHLFLQEVYGEFLHNNICRTWMGESWTTLYSSVVGTGLLLSQQADTPLPPV